MPMSKSVKVAPVFGGDVIRKYSVAGTKSHSFGAIGNVVEHKPLHATIQKDMGALKRKSDKLSVAKEDQGSKNKIPGWKVTAGTDKVKIDRLSASANFENQTTMGANRILDRGNFNEGMMAPPSLPLMTNQRKTLTYEHDPQDTATTKSKSIQGITTVKRKPLSSVGLVGANFTSKVGKDSGNKGAKKISKPLLKISEASDDKNTNPRYPANDGNSVRGKTTRYYCQCNAMRS